MSSQQTGGLRPSRRTLVKGAAWSVPVVAMGASAAAADVVCSPNNTSPECNPVTPPSFQPGSACKFPGGSCDGFMHAYRATFCMTNNTDAAITVNITAIRVNGVTKSGNPSSVQVPPTGQPFCFYTIADATGSSANGTLEFDYNYTYVDEFDVVVPVSGTASTGLQNDLPPCVGCDTEYVNVTPVAGLTVTQATAELAAAGLAVGDITDPTQTSDQSGSFGRRSLFRRSETTTGGADLGNRIVASTEPPAGTEVLVGSKVALVLLAEEAATTTEEGAEAPEGDAAALVTVPTLVGKHIDVAKAELGPGLTLEVTEVPSDAVQAGFIQSASEAAATQVATGTVIQVTVGDGLIQESVTQEPAVMSEDSDS